MTCYDILAGFLLLVVVRVYVEGNMKLVAQGQSVALVFLVQVDILMLDIHYLLRFNKTNSRKRCEICLNLKMKTLERLQKQGVKYVQS